MNTTLLRTTALVALLAGLAGLPGCSIKKKVKKMLDPKASVIGVTVVEDTPERTVIRVDVRTEDVDLLLGFVKLRYKVSLEEAPVDENDNVRKKDLQKIDASGLSFHVTLKHEPGRPRSRGTAVRVQGAIVIKLIAEIATIPFEYRGVVSIPDKK